MNKLFLYTILFFLFSSCTRTHRASSDVTFIIKSDSISDLSKNIFKVSSSIKLSNSDWKFIVSSDSIPLFFAIKPSYVYDKESKVIFMIDFNSNIYKIDYSNGKVIEKLHLDSLYLLKRTDNQTSFVLYKNYLILKSKADMVLFDKNLKFVKYFSNEGQRGKDKKLLNIPLVLKIEYQIRKDSMYIITTYLDDNLKEVNLYHTLYLPPIPNKISFKNYLIIDSNVSIFNPPPKGGDVTN